MALVVYQIRSPNFSLAVVQTLVWQDSNIRKNFSEQKLLRRSLESKL